MLLKVKGAVVKIITMEHQIMIKEISHEPVLVQKTNRCKNRLPLLTTDKQGRLVVLTDNVKAFLESVKVWGTVL